MSTVTRVLTWSAAGLGLAVGAYAAYVGLARSRYGRTRQPADSEDADELLDRFMPVYEVGGRHDVRVAAPAAMTLAAAREMDLYQSPAVRAIIRARELILGAAPTEHARPRGLLDQMRDIGWGVLAERPGRQILVGAVTQPWKPDVVFQALPPDEFAVFNEPGYVKIAWTLRANPIGADHSLFVTETRAVATDPEARAKFRWYWSFFSPGMIVIRWAMLALLRREAKRRAGCLRPG